LQFGGFQLRLGMTRKGSGTVQWMAVMALVCWAGWSAPAQAEDVSLEAPPGVDLPPLMPIGPGVFQIGKVRLDQNRRTIEFPASINMSTGIIEYALVSDIGKLHESLLKTEAEPYHIHIAALFLGADPGPQPAGKALRIGVPVTIWLEWEENGEKRKRRCEDLVYNSETESAMTRGAWAYIGSRIVDGVFLTQRDGSIIATIADPDALIENPRPGRTNEEIWEVYASKSPPVDTPVEVTIQIEEKSELK
jgi:hypothetical protein